MAYIPPHKRHTNADGTEPSLTPSRLAPSVGSSKHHTPQLRPRVQCGGKIIYAGNCISRCWVIGLSDDGSLPESVELQPVACRLIELKTGEKPLAFQCKGRKGDERKVEERPWMSFADDLLQDLVSASLNLKQAMGSDDSLIIKPTLVARFGKVFFHNNPLRNLDTPGRRASISPASMKEAHKTFYTHISDSYFQYVESVVVPKLGMEFEAEREHFHVKVGDTTQPDSTVSCKCNVSADGKSIELHKVELNHVRQCVVDISCLLQDLDLRFMMSTKRVLKKLNDEDDCIRELVKSAILDPNVKGGLRWPMGKESSGNRFSVVGCWHTKYKVYKNSSTRLKIRNADRFDFKTSTGEDAREVNLKLKEVVTHLLKDSAPELISSMLQEKLQIIWENFLTSSHSLG